MYKKTLKTGFAIYQKKKELELGTDEDKRR